MRFLFKCELRHDLFYVDNTRQVRGVLPGHAKRGEVGSSIRAYLVGVLVLILSKRGRR